MEERIDFFKYTAGENKCISGGSTSGVELDK